MKVTKKSGTTDHLNVPLDKQVFVLDLVFWGIFFSMLIIIRT